MGGFLSDLGRRRAGKQQQPTTTDAVAHQPITAAPHRKEERVTFRNAAGQTLVGILFDTGSQDVAILCHGMTDNKSAHFWPAMAETFAARGMSTLRFDFSGNGESEGEFRYGNILLEAEDIRAAVEYARSVGKRVAALAGHSKAGSGVLCYASKYHDVPKVLNICGRFDGKTGIKERFGEDIFDRLDKEGQVTVEHGNFRPWVLTKEDMEDRLALDMAAAASAIPASIHVFTIHGSEDKTIPVESAFQFKELLANNDVHIIEGADHCYTQPEHRKELIEQAAQYICPATQA